MEEKQLELLFRSFLLSKGYSDSNLLSQVTLRSKDERTYRPDLVILDLSNKEYIALIEFKKEATARAKFNALEQIFRYFSLIGTQSIPAFLVFPIAEDDFQILSLTRDNEFEPISKEDFPSLETLSAKRLTEEKIKEREIEENKLKELYIKKRKSRLQSYIALLSLIIGVFASFITIFFQQKDRITVDKVSSVECCDSMQAKYSNLSLKFVELEKQIKSIPTPANRIDTVFSSAGIKKIDDRLRVIEIGIAENPEKALSILQLRNEIEQLKKSDEFIKEITQTKIDSINERLDLLNGWMLGLLITIFGSILGYFITNLRPNRNENG